MNRAYIIDDEKVFKDGNSQRLNAKAFKLHNDLFAGDSERILTSYGHAKVKDPLSFKAFSVFGGIKCDDGENYENDEMHKKGYAVDKFHLYFFSEGSGTHHATIAKACKNPSTFRELFSTGDYSVSLNPQVTQKH